MSGFDRTDAHKKARLLSDDEWQQYALAEAAKAIGQWLEAKVRLERPIHRLTMADLRSIADQSICRWVVLSSIRLQELPEAAAPEKLGWLLMDQPFA